MKVVTIGSAMLDIFIQYGAEHMQLDTDEQQRFVILEEGRKIEVDSLEYYIGGGAINGASAFAHLGFLVTPIAKIGDDNDGAFIVEQLKNRGIHEAYIVSTQEEVTGRSFIIPSPSGNYALLVYRGANLRLQSTDIDIDFLEKQEVVYLTSLSGQAVPLLPKVAAAVKHKNKNCLVATNPGSNQLTTHVSFLIKALNYLDILILNCYEAHLLLNALLPTQQPIAFSTTTAMVPKLLCSPITPTTIRFSLVHYFKEILARGPRIVVVTNGAEGVYVCDGDTIYFHPSIPTELISTIGAGDAFGATFTAMIAGQYNIGDAMRAGVINSAHVLGSLDTTSGLLKKAELDEHLKTMDESLLQCFPLSA